MKQTSGAFRFGRRSLLFFPVIPSGYPAQYHIKKNTKQNQNQQKSIEFYTMQTPPQVKSGLDLLEIMGPQPPPSRARYFGNASTFRHYAARKGPLIFSQCSLWTLPCPNFPLYLPKSGRYSSTACQLCLPNFGTLLQFSFSSFLILFHHHFSLLPLSNFFYVSFLFFLSHFFIYLFYSFLFILI